MGRVLPGRALLQCGSDSRRSGDHALLAAVLSDRGFARDPGADDCCGATAVRSAWDVFGAMHVLSRVEAFRLRNGRRPFGVAAYAAHRIPDLFAAVQVFFADVFPDAGPSAAVLKMAGATESPELMCTDAGISAPVLHALSDMAVPDVFDLDSFSRVQIQ